MTRWRKPLLIAHITASVGLTGTALVLLTLGVAGLGGADPRTVYPAAHLVEVWLAIAALGTGLLGATRFGWRWWVTAKLATTAGFTVAILTVIIPRLATTAADALAGETFTVADRLPLALVPAAATALLVVNVALGVIKPGRRSRRNRLEPGGHRAPKPVEGPSWRHPGRPGRQPAQASRRPCHTPCAR
jgi:hypothetical protein